MRVVIRGAIVALLFVSGSLFAQNSTYRPDPNWKAPVAEAAKKNPLANNASAAKKGRGLFEAQCSMCHGMDGSGMANAANFRNAAVQRESDGTLFWKISRGNQNKGMPSFKNLSETERWQLVSYIRTLRAKRSSK
ncbi:MAG TPA: c-type cytochrome [Terriglobales bacterium]|nr:c-type cytochrome [Terriglobales bacterium]